MPVRRRADGSWLIDGLFEIEKLPEHLEGFELPEGGGDEFQTLSGWFLNHFSRIPQETDHIRHGCWEFEVVDMDGARVDKVVAAFGRSTTGIEFDSLDNAPVKFIVLFVVPKDQFQTHLRTLAAIAKFLNDRAVRERLGTAESASEILNIFENNSR